MNLAYLAFLIVLGLFVLFILFAVLNAWHNRTTNLDARNDEQAAALDKYLKEKGL